ncbi:transglycosylase domain-containing protein [Microbacterium sp. A82]|uniref:transglycosylase domain-containing protein n=1 Tax=Microbacterium sp. A82 TaxID=3450452 RepID=UPI003F2F83B6
MPQKNRTAKGVLGGLLGLVGLAAVAGVLVTATVTPALAVAGAAGSQALDLFDKLPSYLKPDAPMEPGKLYGTGLDGQPFVMATFYDQNRTQVEFDQVAPVMYDAILSSEDKDFYTHGGVNIGATAKALIDNLNGTSSRGASTISQQYVKNVLIQQCEQGVLPGDGEEAQQKYAEAIEQCWWDAANAVGSDGIERKLQEMRYAIQIEKDYSKNDILLGYLNISSFGGTVYGIEAAANRYFSTTAANLTLAQAATLAGIVQNPNTYRIDKPEGSWTDNDGVAHNSAADGYATALDRRNYVLGRMLELGKITQAQFDEADASPITPVPSDPIQGCAAAQDNAYFCQYAKTMVLENPMFGDDEDPAKAQQARRKALFRDGLEIYTSLDMRVQQPAIDSMRTYVGANLDNQYLGAAGVTVEPGTGRVLAMTQNTLFRETDDGDQAYTSLVFASDEDHGGSRGFPVGSTYKLFTLLDWLEKGHSVNESLNGNNRVMQMTASCGPGLAPFNTKEIGNFNGQAGYTGTPMTFTRNSLNSGFFAMASKLDICDINAVADRMGVQLANGDKTTKENLAYDVLGSKFISPLDMAGAYATVANKGVYCEPRAIDRVVRQDGTEMEVPASSCKQVITPEVAATAAYALASVMNGGTGARGNPGDGTPLIGKTGTHQDYSTMMIESSTKATTAVWVGRWNTVPDPDDPTKGIFASIRWLSQKGAMTDARYYIARDMQYAANQLLGGGDRFPAPDRNLSRVVLTDLPSVVGLTMEDARRTLQQAGFTVQDGAPIDSDIAEGLVAAQDPGAGKAPGGATVTISPSNGQGSTVPDVTGQELGDAINTLNAAGFGNVAPHGSCSKEDAEVQSTNPAAGSAATKSTTVTVRC